jgi:hypothetical protein
LLTTGESERTKLFILTEAEVRMGKSNNDGVEYVRDQIFDYLKEKVPNVPGDIFERQSFDHENGLLSTERLETPDLNLWSGKLTEPDTTVAGRSWSLEISIGSHATGVTFGSRLSSFSRHLDFEFDPAVPRLYKDLAAAGVIYGDGIRLARTPTDIQTEGEVDWLIALINNKRRWRNIIALASNEEGICAINPNIFSDRLSAVGHVIRIFPQASFRLSDAIGKFHSVFDQGIRIYRPTAQIDIDKPSTHTLFTKYQLERVDLKRLQISIIMDSFRASVERNVLRQSVPTFVQIRSANATFRLIKSQESGSTVKEQLKAAIAAKTAAEAQAKEALALAVQEESARIVAEDERNQERARALAIYARVQSLEDQLRIAAVQETDADTPEGYEDIPNWVETKFPGRMRLNSRALRGLKEAKFEDVELVCSLLRLLAISYVDSKRGVENAWQNFELGLKERNVELSKSISDNRAGQEGEEYFVKYKNQKRLLEWHLKRGSSRNAERNLRIYFFWDDEDAEVVIGYLPGHLDNRLT